MSNRRVLAAWIVAIAASLAIIGIALCGICYVIDKPELLSQLFNGLLGINS